MINIIRDELNIGAEKPFTIIHMTDTHLTGAYEHESEKIKQEFKARSIIFPNAEDYCEFVSKLSKENGWPIMHTGDFIDFISEEALDKAKKYFLENDIFMAAGNHEFARCVGGDVEDAEYRDTGFKIIKDYFTNNIRADKKEIGGVNFVALDNSYGYFEKWQLDYLNEVLKENKPIVILVHWPLHTERFTRTFIGREGISPVLCVPESLMVNYPERAKARFTADEITKEVYEIIKNNPLIKAVLTGHEHMDFTDEIAENKPHLLTGVYSIRIVDIK